MLAPRRTVRLFTCIFRAPSLIARRTASQQGSSGGAAKEREQEASEAQRQRPAARTDGRLPAAAAMAARLNDPASWPCVLPRRCRCALPGTLEAFWPLCLCLDAAGSPLQVLQQGGRPLIAAGRALREPPARGMAFTDPATVFGQRAAAIPAAASLPPLAAAASLCRPCLLLLCRRRPDGSAATSPSCAAHAWGPTPLCACSG